MTSEQSFYDRGKTWASRPLGRWGRAALLLAVVSAPALLFFDPIGPLSGGHIARDPLVVARVYSDDFAYVSASRNFSRTLSNLFTPHNTHIVPAWRLLTWFLNLLAGNLERLPEVLATAAYGGLAATMMLTARFVSRETGREDAGAAAAVATGTTSLMLAPGTWYSAGQPLWAALATLAALCYAQSWRRSRSRRALGLSMASTVCAGWFWTIGHLAGPVVGLYLWLDGRRSRRWGALAPIAATTTAVGLALLLGSRSVDARGSFHGRTAVEAVHPIEGLFHTCQAIPESLVLGNLGLAAEMTAGQGVLLTLAIVAPWVWLRWTQGGLKAVNPLEAAGATFLVGAYWIEWTVRGYLDYKYLRTINVDMIVPWYHVAPQVGAVMFVVGWSMGPRTMAARRMMHPPLRISRFGALGVLGLACFLIGVHRPRVERLWIATTPLMSPSEIRRFPIPALQRLRANMIVVERGELLRRHLRRYDRAERSAQQMGLGRDAIRRAFGRLDLPGLPDFSDAVDLLNLPESGAQVDLQKVRQALGAYLILEPTSRYPWYEPSDPWPPANRKGPGVEVD